MESGRENSLAVDAAWCYDSGMEGEGRRKWTKKRFQTEARATAREKSSPDFNISMQLLRYMIEIWDSYGKRKRKVEAAQAENRAVQAEKEAMRERLEEQDREITRLKEQLAMAG